MMKKIRVPGLLAAAVCACLFGPAPVAGIEFGGGDTYFELSGFVGTGNAIRLADSGKYRIGISEAERKAVLAQLNKARLSLFGSYPGEMSSQVTLDFQYASVPDRPFDPQSELLLDEAHVDFRVKDLDFRFGLQKVIWGKSDLISPFDILTSRDLHDPFVLPTLEDRVGQAGLRVNYAWGDNSLEGVFFPIWIRSRVPQAQDDENGETVVDEWFPPMAIYPLEGVWLEGGEFAWMIFCPTYNPMKKPKKDLSTATGGVKMNMLKGEYDIDLYLLTTIDPMPTAQVQTTFARGTIQGLPGEGLVIAIEGNMEFKRVTAMGGAVARTWGPVALRSEMAVLEGKQYFRLFDPEGTEEALAEMMYYGLGRVRGQPKSHAEFTWIVGADYEIPRAQIYTSSQLLVTERFSHEEYYTQGETDVNCSFLLHRSFMDDHLSASLTGLAQFISGSVWLGPSVSYTPPFTEDLQLGARLNIFAGDQFSTVGMYKNQSSLVLTMRWLF